jgi:hypothetical protein
VTTGKLLDHWSPPDGAGAPVACLATTFTLEADFVMRDCLSRFLSLSSTTDEGDQISTLAATLEEEDRLAEAQVTILVDRRSPAEKRNLRWDLLPVAAPGGLLHAKVAVLLWRRATRMVIGSANLTAAGYRRQVEVSLALGLDPGCRLPAPFVGDLVTELRHLVQLAPGPATGPKARALATIDTLDERITSLDLPPAQNRDLRLAVAPARPGTSPLDRLADVWRGPQPLWATVLSPFWDAQPAATIGALRRRLSGRPASRRFVTVVTGIDPYTGRVPAPRSLADHADAVAAFDPPDPGELRSLHAKLTLLESDEWLAALIGSSNATRPGLGLDDERGHHELNVWLGCPAGSVPAKRLRALIPQGRELGADDLEGDPPPDEDEPVTPELPTGFLTCTVDAHSPCRVLLSLAPEHLPARWDVRTPAGSVLLDADTWRAGGAGAEPIVPLPDDTLPAYLVVTWDGRDRPVTATWTANVEDRGALPPPAALRGLPAHLLLNALASTRPLPAAVEHELRRRAATGSGDGGAIELDALRRFDDRGLLLQRSRQLSLALWRLQQRLARPAATLDAVHWRLNGAVGPLAIADGLLTGEGPDAGLPGEAQFVLAELALTISAVDWMVVAGELDPKLVAAAVHDVLGALVERRRRLPPAPDPSLDAYLDEALAEAQR